MPFMADTTAWRMATATAIEREHLLDVITMISPTRTPLLSTLPKFNAENYEVLWVTDQLDSEGDPANGNTDVQAFSENEDATFAAVTGPYRIFNRIHHFRETLSISDKLQFVRSVDTTDAYASQMHKRLKLQSKRIEFAAVHSTGQAGEGSGNEDSPTATSPQMFGIRQIARHNGLTGETATWNLLPTNCQGTSQEQTASPGNILTEAMLGDLLSDMWDKGADPTDVWVRPVQKRRIADFTGNSTRNIDAADRALVNTIDVYEGPTGLVIVNLHPMMVLGDVLVTETDLLEWAILKPTTHDALAKVGDADKGMIETSLTLIYRSPAALGLIFGLDDTYY